MKGGEPVDVFVRIPFESRPDDTGDRDRMGLTIGLDSMDPKWRDFRPYLIGFARKVEMYWRAVLAKYPQARTGVGVVGIRLIVNSRGELGGVVHMETPPIDGARAGMLGCGDAVKASAPFAKWTPEMTAALGNEQDLMLYFTL
jgi:hypothetical protein